MLKRVREWEREEDGGGKGGGSTKLSWVWLGLEVPFRGVVIGSSVMVV